MMFKKLGDIASFINGYPFKPEDRGDKGLPIIRIQYLTGHSYDLGFYDGEYPKSVEINNGDVLISWSATIGVYVWNNGKAILNQHIFKVVFDKIAVDKQYFVYAVKHRLDEMTSKAHGATMRHIVKKDFDNTEIPFPSMDEQHEIAQILDQVSAIRAARQKQLSALDKLVKARFIEMFGDPIENSQGRLTTVLINVVKMQRGFDLPVQDRCQDGIIPVYGSNGPLDRHDIAKIQGGGVITGRSGTIGKVFYTESDYWPLNTTLFSVDTHKNNIIYLAYLLELYDLTRFVEGTGVPTLNRNMFHNKPIIDVGIEEQEQFASFVRQVDRLKSTIRESLTQTETLFNSLMQQYFG